MSLSFTVSVNVLNCVPQKQKNFCTWCWANKDDDDDEICEVYDNQLFSKIIRNPCHILNQLLPSVSALQLQKTTTSDHANIIDCFRNVLHVSLMLILFTEIFTVTFINDCAVTTIFTISLLRLRSVNLLFNKRICVCLCVLSGVCKHDICEKALSGFDKTCVAFGTSCAECKIFP